MPGKLDRSWSVLKLRVLLEGRCPIKQFKKIKKNGNREHFPCFYGIIEKRVELCENEKCKTQFILSTTRLTSSKLSRVFL